MSYSVSAIEDELYKTDVAVLAAEDWAKGYSKDPKSHAMLIRAEAGMLRSIRRFFKELSAKAGDFIDWGAYNHVLNDLALKAVQAADNFNVNVIVKDVPLEDSDGTFMKIVFDDIVAATTAGALSGQTVYGKQLGIASSDSFIQQAARSQIAKLVGKRIDKDGNIIDNPKAEYRISDKTRADIQSSIRTSLSLGEDQGAAVDRLRSVINNASRAETIASTESVNAYGSGLSAFGRESDAVGKEWQDAGANDECADNAAAGPIPLEEDFPSGDSEPAAHPNCRCTMRLIYQNELDADPGLFD